jgi:hypothetical protein
MFSSRSPQERFEKFVVSFAVGVQIFVPNISAALAIVLRRINAIFLEFT